jgi:hypothetical protein
MTLGDSSFTLLHFGVIFYVALVTETKIFIKFMESFVWSFILKNEEKEKYQEFFW